VSVATTVIALLQISAPPDALPTSMLGMLINSDPVTKSVLALLVVLSLLSWAIMFSKWKGFKTAETHGRAFVTDFERARGMDDAMLIAQRAKPSAFTSVFARAVSFLNDTKPEILAARSSE
jgi:biopolymer transport protein TolQ